MFLCGTKLVLHSQISAHPSTAVIEQLSGESLQYFSHGLEEWSVFIRLSDDIRLGGVASTGESRVTVQSDLEQPEGNPDKRWRKIQSVQRRNQSTRFTKSGLLESDEMTSSMKKWPRIFRGLQMKCRLSVRCYCKRDGSCFGLLQRVSS